MGAVARETREGDSSEPKSCFGIRHVQAAMLFLAMAIMNAMRVNMSVAIVAMTDTSIPNSFDWSLQTKSVLLSSFFWAYCLLQIPVGLLTSKVGGKRLILAGMAINSVITLASPWAASYGGWKLLCACRVLQGITQSPLYPGTHYLISKWVPLEEKGRMISFIYAGTQLGNGLELISAGFLASIWGWPAIFYVLGILAAAWSLLYTWIGSDSPQQSRIISQEERAYIQKSLGHIGGPKKLPTPWRDLLTSLPFYALIIAHMGQNWGYWTLLTEMPTYMKKVLGVDIKESGFLSALPYFAMYLLSFPMAFWSDLSIKRKWLSVTTARKISNSIAHWGPAVALVGLSYSPPGNLTVAVVLLTITVALNAGQFTGCMAVHIDMAPNFASILMGFTNCFGNMTAVLAPLTVGFILKDDTNAEDWRTVFFLSSAIYFSCNLFFVLFGTCKTQSWNEPSLNISECSVEEKSGGSSNKNHSL